MHDTAVWRQARDANLATAQASYGVQLGTFAHAGDCVYDVDLCMPGMGDTDDRWSNHLSIAVQDQTYPALRSYSGAFDVRKSHSEPLQADFVLRDVVTFLANQPAAAMGAAPATPPTMAATPTASRYDYSSWIDAGAGYWLEVTLQAGQRLDVTFGVGNADQKIDAWITGPTSGPSVASRTYQASGQMSLPPVSVDGIYEVRWSNARSMFRGRGITATLTITGP
jgi:hypothetical protein